MYVNVAGDSKEERPVRQQSSDREEDILTPRTFSTNHPLGHANDNGMVSRGRDFCLNAIFNKSQSLILAPFFVSLVTSIIIIFEDNKGRRVKYITHLLYNPNSQSDHVFILFTALKDLVH